MEPRRNSAGREYAAASPVWPSQQACTVWWILDGKDDEDCSIQNINLGFIYHFSLVPSNFLYSWEYGYEESRYFLATLALAGCVSNSERQKQQAEIDRTTPYCSSQNNAMRLGLQQDSG